MNEKPIIFATPMVQAILAGRKTQTRRVIKPQPGENDRSSDTSFEFFIPDRDKIVTVRPKYQPGDVLWVREMWRIGAWREPGCKVAIDYKASPELVKTPWVFLEERVYLKYRDSVLSELNRRGIQPQDGQFAWDYGQAPLSWRPSIHMPRAAARIFLRVTDVRAERVQEITEEDANAEGIRSYWLTKEAGEGADGWHESNGTFVGAIDHLSPFHSTRCKAYQQLWDSLNAKRGFGWAENPWVWVIEFERVATEL